MDAPAHTDPHLLLLAAVSDPVRLRLMALLREPSSVSDLCQSLQMAQPRISHHLAVLRDCGLVVVERDGRRRVHRWNDGALTGPQRDIQSLLERWFADGLSQERPTPAAAPQPLRQATAEIDDFLL